MAVWDGNAVRNTPAAETDHVLSPVAWPATGEPVPSVEEAPAQTRGESARSLIWEVVQTILLTVAIFLAVRSVVQNFRVEGASMDPTLHSGQYLLINKVIYARTDGTPLDNLLGRAENTADPSFIFGGPRRGEVIVFRAPTQTEKDFIKRVIGLPGETVRIVGGQVFVNNRPIDEPYIEHRATYDLDQKTVPPGSYFVLGDNRPNSSDSHLGWFVPANNIIGRAWVSYWPPTYWGVMPVEAYER
ncbi:MAG: signal peptidase I [Chloroflexota bacterium]